LVDVIRASALKGDNQLSVGLLLREVLFEFSFCKGYVIGKAFKTLKTNMVPIVYRGTN
jgi:hypothetical protein